MTRHLRPAIGSLLVFTALCGAVYPLAMDGIAALCFPHQATGSLVRDPDGRVVGSALIGQPFTDPAYFWSRPTAQAHYDASSSTGTNLAQSGFVAGTAGRIGPNAALTKQASDRVAALRAADPGNLQPVPVDLVTASASGLDPDISPEAAYYQAPRIARRRGRSEADVRALVEAHIHGRTFGILGEPRVDVLLLNRAVDAAFGPPKPNG